MKLRYFLFLFLLPLFANATWINWSGPESVRVGESFTITATVDPETYDIWGFDISLYQDGGLVNQQYSAYEISYTTSCSTAGSVSFSVDAYGVTGSVNSSFTVNVVASNQPPHICYDGLSSSSVVQGTGVVISGWATDYEQGAPVSRVAIFVDNGYVGDASLSGYRPDVQAANISWGGWSPLDVTYSGWSYSINTSALSPGSHSAKAIPYDNQGAYSDDAGYLYFTVNQDQPPNVCYNGLDKTSVVRGGTVMVSGWALDPEQGAPVSRVEVIVNNAYVGTATLGGYRPDVQDANITWGQWSSKDVTYSGWSYNINTSNLPYGSNWVKVVGYDVSGRSTVMDPLYFTVTSPVVYNVSVVNGSATPAQGEAGAAVQLRASIPTGFSFSYWQLDSGSGSFSSTSSQNTTFYIGSSNATVRAVLVDTAPPSAPSGLTASGITASSVYLNWSASSDNSGVSYYQIRLNGSSTASSGSCSYQWGSLSSSTTYLFEVRAFDAAGNSSPWASVYATTNTLVDVTAPSIPAGLTGTVTGNTSVRFSWTPSYDAVGVTKYELQLQNSTNNPRQQTATAASYLFTDLSAGMEYTLIVRAGDAAGNWSAWSTGCTVTTTGTSGLVYLSFLSISPSSKPVITTTETMLTRYKLRCKMNYSNGGDFHAATSWNNNNMQLDVLPAPGVYTTGLYWLKYSSDGTKLYEIGPSNVVTVTVLEAAAQDSDGDGIPDAVENQLGTNPNSADPQDSGNSTNLNIHTPKP